MENIYETAVNTVIDGARFCVDFGSRTLTVGKKKLIDNGEYEGKLGVSFQPFEQVVSQIEHLYAQYKHSVPSERSENKKRRYFKAVKEHELTDADMVYGMPRDEAQIRLELYVLCMILNGSLVWNEDKAGTWFWQSSKDKDLIILRQWVENYKSLKTSEK